VKRTKEWNESSIRSERKFDTKQIKESEKVAITNEHEIKQQKRRGYRNKNNQRFSVDELSNELASSERNTAIETKTKANGSALMS